MESSTHSHSSSPQAPGKKLTATSSPPRFTPGPQAVRPSQLERGNDPGWLLTSQTPLHHPGVLIGGGSTDSCGTATAGPIAHEESSVAATVDPRRAERACLHEILRRDPGSRREVGLGPPTAGQRAGCADDRQLPAGVGQPRHDLGRLVATTEADIDDTDKALDPVPEDLGRKLQGPNQTPGTVERYAERS